MSLSSVTRYFLLLSFLGLLKKNKRALRSCCLKGKGWMLSGKITNSKRESHLEKRKGIFKGKIKRGYLIKYPLEWLDIT